MYNGNYNFTSGTFENGLESFAISNGTRMVTLQPISRKKLTLTQLDFILLISYAVIFLIGTIGNSLVCLYFKLSNRRIKIMEYMIICLAITDLFASITNPFLFTYWQLTFKRKWHFGYVGCKMLPIVIKATTSVSLGIIMLINIDRCIVITRPFRPKMNKRDVNMAILLIILIAIVMEIPFIYFHEISPGWTCTVPNSTAPAFAYPVLTIYFLKGLLFLSVFLITVLTIYRELNNKEMKQHLQDVQRAKKNKAVLQMLATIAAVFTVLVFPREILHVAYIISHLMGKGIPYNVTIRNINSAFKVLHMCNSICNVFIYAGLHRRFRPKFHRRDRHMRGVRRKVPNMLLPKSNGSVCSPEQSSTEASSGTSML